MSDVDDEEGVAAPAPGGAGVTQTAAVPMDKLAKIYRKMAAARAELQRKFDEEDERIKVQQDVVAQALKDQMLALGLNSVRTGEGTVILSIKKKFNTQDWDSMKQFILQYEAVDLLEKRIAQGNMGKWLEENPDKVPPGLNTIQEYAISVRKPTNGKKDAE